jgi:hypothetical protein
MAGTEARRYQTSETTNRQGWQPAPGANPGAAGLAPEKQERHESFVYASDSVSVRCGV